MHCNVCIHFCCSPLVGDTADENEVENAASTENEEADADNPDVSNFSRRIFWLYDYVFKGINMVFVCLKTQRNIFTRR